MTKSDLPVNSIIYRPPFEASTPLLQVTSGCSWNRCRFCSMYADVPFKVQNDVRIEEDIAYLAATHPKSSRVFVENGNAFCLPAEKLLGTADLIHKHMPDVDTICIYASIRDIARKSDEELHALREAGYDDVNIGLESGNEETLRFFNKGYDAAEAKRQLLRMKAAGFHYVINVIFGGLGTGHAEECAKDTAALINRVQPQVVFTETVHGEPGSMLYEDMRVGSFKEATIGEYFDEMILFTEALELEDCVYYAWHPANITTVRGHLPEDKDAILREIRGRKNELTPSVLAKRPMRFGGEGAILSY